MSEYPTLSAAIDGVLRNEPCSSKNEALIALGLRALLAAIGNIPAYRQHYIVKGGTLLRLLATGPLERFSTDLDFSGIELPGSQAADHYNFAAQIGRQATQLLHSTYRKGAADVHVTFVPGSPPHEDGENPETLSYLIKVSAQLQHGKITQAQSKAYKIDVTLDEYIDPNHIDDLRVISYGIPIDVRSYSPLQSMSEKLRAILQKNRHFVRKHDRGNLVPRHLFDLLVLRGLVSEEELSSLPELFRKKCSVRHVPIDGHTRDRLLDERLLERAMEDEKNKGRAQSSWAVLIELSDRLNLP